MWSNCQTYLAYFAFFRVFRVLFILYVFEIIFILLDFPARVDDGEEIDSWTVIDHRTGNSVPLRADRWYQSAPTSVEWRFHRHSNQHLELSQGSALHDPLSGWRWRVHCPRLHVLRCCLRVHCPRLHVLRCAARKYLNNTKIIRRNDTKITKIMARSILVNNITKLV